jgi:hypothetical protein
VNAEKVRAVREHCRRVSALCAEVLKAEAEDSTQFICGTKATGALRRASMDLTRSLSELRRKS